jgi:hypothetical protein
MTRRPKRAKPPVDEKARENAKLFMRIVYDPEGEKQALDEYRRGIIAN